MQRKTVYYNDPINDDFAGNHIEQKKIDESYPFGGRSLLWRFFAAIVYYVIAAPVVYLICRVFIGMSFKNVRAVKKLKSGYCLYINHTHYSDVYIPSILAWPKRAYIISSADAVSVKGFSWLTPMLGAVPIPTGISGMTKFVECIRDYCKAGSCLSIFPEAHIWPYYTGVRPLQKTSFRYPVAWDCPMVVAAVTYQKRRGLNAWRRSPRRTVYVSEPIFVNAELPKKEAQAELTKKAQAFMDEMTARYSTYSPIEYLPNQN